MSQTAVDDEPVQAYEGKVQVSGSFPTTNISRIASVLIYFGKLVTPLSGTELAVGGAGPQEVKLPTSAAEILRAENGGGIAIADPSIERLRVSGGGANSAPYGAYPAEDSLAVMRKGQIWVVVETALASLDDAVLVRFQNPGGSPPAAQLGSFTTAAGADFAAAPAGLAWLGSALIGGVDFALLSVNLPG